MNLYGAGAVMDYHRYNAIRGINTSRSAQYFYSSGEGGPAGAGGGVTAEDVALTAFGATEDGWNSLYYYNCGTLYLQSTWRYARSDEFMLTMACSNCDEVDVLGIRDNDGQQGQIDNRKI